MARLFFIVGRVAFDIVAPVVDFHPLPARAQGQQQAVIEKPIVSASATPLKRFSV